MSVRSRLITAIGLIASCIGIFAFFTGWQSIWDILKANPVTESSSGATQSIPGLGVQLSTNTPRSPTNIGSTPTHELLPTSFNTPQPTSTPQQAKLVETGENYVVEQIPSGQTSIELNLNVPSGFPFDSQEFDLYLVVQDIAGNWQLSDKNDEREYDSDFDRSPGIMKTMLSPDGYWALEALGDPLVGGRWASLHKFGLNEDRKALVFPVDAGWTTRITITLSKLEIGLIETNSKQALIDQLITLRCTGTDIAGNIIGDETCGYAGTAAMEWTDQTGVATFYVGPGSYFAEADDRIYYDIQISTGEEKRLIFSFP